jgi:hypothetical protein
MSLATGMLQDHSKLNTPDLFTHVHSNVERRKLTRDWTKKEFCNVIADRTAAGDYDFIHEHCTNVHILNISMAKVLSIINEQQTLFLSKDNNMYLQSLRTAFREQTSSSYLEHRDNNHLCGEWETWDWQDTHLEFTSKVFHYNECSIAERSHHTRRIYNKLYQQWNIFRYDKGKHPNITNQCRLCGQVDSMQHLITNCTGGGVSRIWPEAKHALDTIRAEMGDNKYLDNIIDAIKHLLKLPDATHIWTATWQPSQVQYLHEQLQLAFNFNNLSSLEINIIQTTLLRINAVLIEYTKEIVNDRIHRLQEIDKNIKNPLRKPKERRDYGSILIKVRKLRGRVKTT